MSGSIRYALCVREVEIGYRGTSHSIYGMWLYMGLTAEQVSANVAQADEALHHYLDRCESLGLAVEVIRISGVCIPVPDYLGRALLPLIEKCEPNSVDRWLSACCPKCPGWRVHHG